MILRTPPPKRPRDDVKAIETSPVGSDRRQPLIIYEDPAVIVQHPDDSSHEPHQPSDHMLCTYQCRQMVKSDFFDALSNAEKQASDYQSKLETLNENFSKADAERKKFRDQFLYAEQELAAAKGREKALQEQLLKEINDSQERLKKQLESCSKLEIKLENEMKLRKKAESSATSAEEKASVLEGKLAHLSESIEKEKKRLNNELVQLQRDSKLSVSRITADHEKMECRAKNAEKESELLKAQLEDLKLQLSECLHQKGELEKKLSSFAIQEGSSTEGNILVKHLQEELRNCESEVREARKLKSSYENVELLKEKLLEEKSRRERAESELSKFQELELNMRNLEDELSSWKSLIKEIPNVSCCDDIPLKFAALQKEMIDNMMKVGEANARVKQMEVALDAAHLGKQNAETEVASAKEKAKRLKLEVNQIELMLCTVTEERDGLKNIVDELRRSKNEQAGDESASGTLLQEFESSLLKKECYIKELESNLHEQKEASNRQLDEIKLLNDRLNNEARRFKSLERESDRLRSEISLLESKLGHGDFSAANTKVLRMVNTLGVDNDAKQTIEALRTELEKTKEKLQAVEELKSQSGDAGKLVDSYISGKITQLKEQIATLEKREERYKTVFADRISVFRRACCELFGYKIVMDEHQRSNGIPVTRFTLQSIYAQSEDEKLEFEYESGNTNILANAYTSQSEISRQVDIFIHKMNSIPAFTANLTVESFNKRTLC
ncbi:mitotic spindle checkpoint protein MAD1 [Ricinus communis]|uniref:Spindle assembly checkpoint component mad1, putative n=1 Tax=Ricinus communis TaxID=3988 RepID=B9SPB2_RICCO|nr:mitotic spindle checkpoint protein MAD1 [Ricinus communis]EEF34534.1 Spindle assembly checkpoint component mad1, putative [Ricinus communis]|eukprot:XP_002527831.1 mitotic spindle checkpoint protein MAD1 [Ricinus communis]